MAELNIFSNRLSKLAGLSNAALLGYPTFRIVFYPDTSLPEKIVVICLYSIALLISAILVFAKDKSGVEDTVRMPDFESKGITDLEPDYNEIKERFKTARNAIDIIVYHGEQLLLHTKDELIKAINRGVTVRLLIAPKGSKLLQEIWKLENKDEKIESKRVDNAYIYIDEIRKETSENPHRFLDQQYNTQIRYSAIIVDNKWAWWTPYHPGKKVETITSFILNKTGEAPIIDDCINHFGRLWHRIDQDSKEIKTVS